MAAVLDPSKPFSAELHVIRRLNSSLYRSGGRRGLEPECLNSPLARFRPPAEPVATAPLRTDVPLLDPCCGQLSAAAEVDLEVKGRRKFIDFHHVPSALWVPPGFRERSQTAPNPCAICVDLDEDKTWSSRRICGGPPSGSTSPVKVQHNSQRTIAKAATHSRLPEKHNRPQDAPSSALRLQIDDSLRVQRYRFTSTTQRSYEEVGWFTKLPRHLKGPETTLGTMADPVSERPSSRRYHSRPQLWQSIGSEWNRQQLRLRNDAKKPISFCSGCPRSGQIPLYTGTIGSENMDNIDNMDEDFQPLTLKRSIMPPYTPTARRTTIPGYTGKAAYANCDANATVPVPPVSPPTCSSGTIGKAESPVFGHVAPLSRMVTTMTPCNPFLRPALPASRTDTRGNIRRCR